MSSETVHHHPEDPDIILHPQSHFEKMRKAGRLSSQTLDHITPHIRAGITTDEINTLCHDFIVSHDAIPAALNYRGFPKSVCTSVNHVVCHGIPGDRKLVEGDIINVDVALILGGWYGDNSRMYKIGKVGIRANKLCDVTYEAMMLGIDVVRPGATLGDIGFAIQSHAHKHGFSIVRDFCGHGLGEAFHLPPTVLHYGRPGQGTVLMEGMFFTIEPMVNVGRPDVKILKDEWTAVTRDRSLSAQYEHSLGVTKDGYEIFTQSD